MHPDYEGYEELTRFSPGQLQSYREMLLDKTKPQVEFIVKHLVPSSVVEVGSGNGRLLIAAGLEGWLKRGVGFELSKSRVEFARRWELDLRLRERGPKVEFFDVDVLKVKPEEFDGDLAVCITGCFQYFRATSPKAPEKLLSLMRYSKFALFELYKRPPMGRTWHELPPDDPWIYLLDEYEDQGEWVKHTKTFVNRRRSWDREEDRRVEHLTYYSVAEFSLMLARAGFGTMHELAETDTAFTVLVS